MDSKLFKIDPRVVKEQEEIGRKGVEAEFVKAVKKRRWRAYKFTSEMNRGVSDRLVIIPGQVWFVEIKRTSGSLTKLQESFRRFCVDFGANHFTVYGKEGIDDFFKAVAQKTKEEGPRWIK